MLNPYFQSDLGNLYNGDVLETLRELPDESVDCCITSPPYWNLRDYDVAGQIGAEKDFRDYLENLWRIFTEVYRALKPTGSCYVNLGDTYAGSGGTDNKSLLNSKQVYSNSAGIKSGKVKGLKDKSLCNIPARFAIGMTDRGWILRNKIIWLKPNAMPESAKDRFTVDYEEIFFFVKNKKYFFNQQFEPLSDKTIARCNGNFISKRGDKVMKFKTLNQKRYADKVKNGGTAGRNKRAVWSISTKPFHGAHFACFPQDIPETIIKASCPEYICEKCGEPREAIYAEETVERKPSIRKIAEINNVSESSVFRTNAVKIKTLGGLTDCGCGGGFKSGTVIDIFMGSGTTALAAEKLNRKWIGIELNKKYCEMAAARINVIEKPEPLLFDVDEYGFSRLQNIPEKRTEQG